MMQYMHWMESTAQSDIKKLGINNVNGLEYDTGKAWKAGDVFWRISGK